MIERNFTNLRNTRKHFVKCVDCGCQTLPQNAAKEGAWAAAASLSISGRVNDGVLCFNCTNKRRGLLGLPLNVTPTDGPPSMYQAIATEGSAATCQATLKKVRINTRECSLEINSLESLVATWCEATFPKASAIQNRKFLLVAVNNTRIQTADFNSTPISDGDEITISVGGKF